MTNETNINQLVDHLFRHESGRIVATLTRIFGAGNLQLAEDVVQETLIKAMQQWSYKGIPENPSAWLMTVAKNRALDILRRDSNYQQKLSLIEPEIERQSFEDSLSLDDSIEDDMLVMLFMGCHPALSTEMQITLLLKTLAGFSVSEIAHAFLLSDATIAQRIVRAKRTIREKNIIFKLPDETIFSQRLHTVLMVIYLLFSEGYKASEGNQLIRNDLCYEAIRLCELLLGHPQGNLPEVHALMALMLLQSSRLDARIKDGHLILLSEQDRTQWNQNAIQPGLYHLEQSASGNNLSVYHLQAGIAACHATARSYEATDWQQILNYYDLLIKQQDSPIIQLNRLVALSYAENVVIAKAQLQELTGLEEYYLYHATLADFDYRLNKPASAITHYRIALSLTYNTIEQRFIEERVARIEKSPS